MEKRIALGIEGFEAAIASNIVPSILFLTLIVAALILFWTKGKIWAYVIAVLFLAMCFPVATLGYSITIPFLILGSFAISSSTLISYLFNRARALA